MKPFCWCGPSTLCADEQGDSIVDRAVSDASLFPGGDEKQEDRVGERKDEPRRTRQSLRHTAVARRTVMQVRPLLCDLEDEFKSHCDEDGLLSVAGLSDIWKEVAMRKMGHLLDADIAVIEESARTFLEVLDLDQTGKVTYEEFIIFMMGGTEERGSLHDMRSKLQDAMAEDPHKLKKVIQRFKAWDSNGDGQVTRAELDGHMAELAEMMGKSSTEGEDMAAAIFDEADVNGDGSIDLWEAVAHSLGRKKTPVELLVYDITKGMSNRFSFLLLGQTFEAIYHTGVLVYGNEYWYGGKLFKSKPPLLKTFGPPLSNEGSSLDLKPSEYLKGRYTLHVGHTLATQQEWHDHVNNHLCVDFTADGYDVISNNCNNYANACVEFLTGASLPAEIMGLPELLMHTKTVALLRPFLNRWLGGFGDGSQTGLVDTTDDDGNFACTEPDTPTHIKKLTLGTGRVVMLPDVGKHGEPVVAAVTEVFDEEHCEVRYFDPEKCVFVSKKVSIDEVDRTEKDKELAMCAMPTGG